MRASTMILAAGLAGLAGCAPVLSPQGAGPSLHQEQLRVRWSGSATSPVLWVSRPAHAAIFVVGGGHAQLLDTPVNSRQWLTSGHHHLGHSLRKRASLGHFNLAGQGAQYLVAIVSDAPLRHDLSLMMGRSLYLPVQWSGGSASVAGLQHEIARLTLSDPRAPWSASVLPLHRAPSSLAYGQGQGRGTYTMVCPDGRRFEVPRGFRIACPPAGPATDPDDDLPVPGDDDGAVAPPRQRPVPAQAPASSGVERGVTDRPAAPRSRPAAERPTPAAERPAPGARPAAPAPARRPAAMPQRPPAEERPTRSRPQRESEDATE
jgi:hypothetical protein